MLDLLITVILPIFLLLGVGYLLDQFIKLDLGTLNRLVFYILITAAVFNALIKSTLSIGEIASVGLFTLVQLAVWAVIALALFSLPYFREHRIPFAYGMLFINGANYGIPMMLLAFGEQGVSIIGVVLTVNLVTLFSLGILLVSIGKKPFGEALKELLTVPVVYAVPVGIVMMLMGWQLPPQIDFPVSVMADSFIPVALITLGIQLSRTPLDLPRLPRIGLGSLGRLVIGPAVTYALARLWGFSPDFVAILTVAAAVPTAVSVYIVCAEYDQDGPTASQIVAVTTLLSALTVPLVILLVR